MIEDSGIERIESQVVRRGSKQNPLLLARYVAELEKHRKETNEAESRVIRNAFAVSGIVAAMLGALVALTQISTPLFMTLAAVLMGLVASIAVSPFSLNRLAKLEADLDAKRRAVLQLHD